MNTGPDNDVTNRTSVIYAEKKLSCHDQSDQVPTVMKTT